MPSPMENALPVGPDQDQTTTPSRNLDLNRPLGGGLGPFKNHPASTAFLPHTVPPQLEDFCLSLGESGVGVGMGGGEMLPKLKSENI